MKRYKFTQHIPAFITGVEPKKYDFNSTNELLETELFQRFADYRFEVYEENGQPSSIMIYHRGNSTPNCFGNISVNEVKIIDESVKMPTNNPFESNVTGGELDMIKRIMNKPHIHVTQEDMEQTANQIGEGVVPDARTPEQMLGLL